MGLWDKVTSQFIEVIEWLDDTPDTLVYRFPVYNQEIKMGAKLTVRESQTAVFVNEGQVADVFTPGLYTLSTQNMPIMTTLCSWKYGFNSPFKAEVYFVSMRQFTDLKWGTANPIMLRDPEFGPIRLRAYGIYSMRVSDPRLFVQQIVGTNSRFQVDEISGQLKRQLVSGFTDILGESKIAALDLAANYDELSQMCRSKLANDFASLGLDLTKFVVENISLPPEVEQALDKRASMGIIGDMRKYTQFQAANALEDAARNPGGDAGTGAGLGAGFAMGQMIAQSLGQSQQTASPAGATVTCSRCGTAAPQSSKFCPGCGNPLSPTAVACIKCGAQIAQGAKFCNECGAPQTAKVQCPNCKTELPTGAKFCHECGTRLE